MNNVIPFQFHESHVRVILGEQGEPWFVAKDVAELLEYADTDQAVRSHCRAAKTCPVKLTGQVRRMKVIPERDVYRLVMRSTMPAAVDFEEWVVGEVLPAIRRTGGYQAPANDAVIPPERRLPVAADSFDAARRISESLGLSGNQATLCANRMVKETLGVDVMELAGVQRLVNEAQELNYTATELGIKFDLTAQQMNKLLERAGLQRHAAYAKGRRRWELLPDGRPYAVITDTAKKHSDGKPVQQILWKESVLEPLRRLAEQIRADLPKRPDGRV